MSDRPGREVLRTYLIGLCMGSADAVPGVSGGTIALIAGVYERLIAAVTSLTPGAGVRLAGAALPPFDRETAAAVLGEVDARFLVPLGVGMATALVLVARAIHYADTHRPVALFGFFFGLIAASAVVLGRQISLRKPRHLAAALAGFLLAFVLAGDATVLAGHGPGLTFLAGAVALSAMILPGISGSLMLVILGQYTYLTGTLSTLTGRLAGLLTGGSADGLVGPGLTVATFLAGGVVGVLTMARVVERALEADRETTLAFLVSLVVGALRAPVAELGARESVGWTAGTVGEFALVALVGAVLLFALDRYAVDVEIATTGGR